MSWNFFTNAGALKTSNIPTSTMPAGTIVGYAGATAPLGFLFCDASAVSRSGYSALYAAIGTAFGAGDGTTTFNLPDLRGRTIVGLGTNAAVNALALSDGVAVANRRPQHRHTPHTHANVDAANWIVASAAGNYGSTPSDRPGQSRAMLTADGGSGVSTDSLDAPAFLVTNYIISTTTVAPVVASNVTAYGGSVASASSIAITGNSTYLLTGTTGVSTVTGGVTGNSLTILASGQATGVCVVLNNGTTANALNLRDSANLGIYAGESVTFVYNGTYWVEVARNLKTLLQTVPLTSNASVTAIGFSTGSLLQTAAAWTYDGATPIVFEYSAAGIVMDASVYTYVSLGESTTELYNFVQQISGATTSYGWAMYGRVQFTPTNAAHTYLVKAYNSVGGKSSTIYGSAAQPSYLNISRAL